MSIAKFLLANWDSVLVIIGAVAGVIFLYKRGETELLKEILFRLVTKAEQEFGGGTGELKKAAVMDWLYERMPVVLRLVISRTQIEKLIDDVLAYAKTKWAANEKLNEIVMGAASGEGRIVNGEAVVLNAKE